MKWSELEDGTKVVLQQPLYSIAKEAENFRYQYLTKAEIDNLVTEAHPVGKEFTYYGGEDASLQHDDGDISINKLDEIDNSLYLVVVP